MQMGYRRGGLTGYEWLDRLIQPASFMMTRKMLLGVKRRAETLAPIERRAA